MLLDEPVLYQLLSRTHCLRTHPVENVVNIILVENELPNILATGASAAVGHHLENSIPLSIFPIAADKLCICFCGLPGRGKTHIARRLGRYLSFFHALPLEVRTFL
jgi:hypothetical protein